jgi:two-component system, sensor histidine kinase and response regulator
LRAKFGDRYLIATANSGPDGLQILKESRDDGHEVPVAIADYIMPGMRGDEFLARLHAVSPETRTILLTGQAEKAGVVNAINHANLYRYIGKPWEPLNLALTIKEAIQSYVRDQDLARQNTVLRDLTQVLEAQIEERTHQLHARRDLLTELNASKSRFLSILAQDLRAPFRDVVDIINCISQRTEQFERDEISQQVSELQKSVEHVCGLLDNLLNWAEVQRGLMPYQPKPVAIATIFTEQTQRWHSLATRKEISLKHLAPDGMLVYADKQMLHMVLRNMLSNALKFTDRGGMVRLSATQHGHYIHLEISDSGIGIPEDSLPRLFRLDEKVSREGTAGETGTGLGLILSKALVEKNHGTLSIESEVDCGTIVTIRSPIGKQGV